MEGEGEGGRQDVISRALEARTVAALYIEMNPSLATLAGQYGIQLPPPAPGAQQQQQQQQQCVAQQQQQLPPLGAPTAATAAAPPPPPGAPRAVTGPADAAPLPPSSIPMGMPPSAAIYGGQPLPLGQPGPPGAPPGGPPGAPGRPARPPGNPPPLRGPGGIQKAGGLLAPRISGTQQQVARANWWNDETDVALRRLVGTHGRSWQYISELLGTGKTAKACESRFTRLEARDKKLAKGKGGMVPEKSPPWTAVEDGALRSIVQVRTMLLLLLLLLLLLRLPLLLLLLLQMLLLRFLLLLLTSKPCRAGEGHGVAQGGGGAGADAGLLGPRAAGVQGQMEAD